MDRKNYFLDDVENSSREKDFLRFEICECVEKSLL